VSEREAIVLAQGSVRLAGFWAHVVLAIFVALEVVLPIALLACIVAATLDEVPTLRFIELDVAASPFGGGLFGQAQAKELGNLIAWALMLTGGLVVVKAVATIQLWSGVRMEKVAAASTDRITCLRQLSKAEAAGVWGTVEKLAQRMGVTEQLTVWLSPAVDRGPSVTVKDGTVYLVLTVGSLLVRGSNKEAFEAIVSHELAHVLQKDHSLWGFTEGARLYLGKYVREALPLVGLMVFLFDVTCVGIQWKFAFVNALVVVLPSALLSFAAERLIVRCRSISERTADDAAKVFVGTEATTAAQSLYVTRGHDDIGLYRHRSNTHARA
jgi:hypothetical protein